MVSFFEMYDKLSLISSISFKIFDDVFDVKRDMQEDVLYGIPCIISFTLNIVKTLYILIF